MRIISRAEGFILLDMFLLNEFQGPKPESTRKLSSELANALIKRKSEAPGIRIIFITDPINTVYGGMRSAQLEALRAAGVEVVVTRLERLRDSNPLYSALWRVFIRPFGNSVGGKRMKNPFGEGRVSLRSWLKLMNFKANHRKVLLADAPGEPGGWVGLVTSANPHDASSAHGNIAVRFTGKAVADLMESERAVLRFSGGKVGLPEVDADAEGGGTAVSVLTESAIKDALLAGIRKAGKGDRLMLATFYLSDRDVVRALKEARERGAKMMVLLDPNFDAFGHEKNGIPNRQVGAELADKGVPVRWCDTHGEQCHAKILLVEYSGGTSRLVAGSANFTRRNLDDLNLETDVLVEGPSVAHVFRQARKYFGLVWGNSPGETYSVPFGKYAEDSLSKTIMYRVMEATGMCTF
jgi:phosphatidylserine/phosphatidylglycerophosphate/cardiolipin synthase-like enzyme